MLAKNVNDNACFLDKRDDGEFFAGKLAPTTEATLFKCGSLPAIAIGIYTTLWVVTADVTTMRSESLLILISGAPLNHAGRTQA